MVHAAYRLDLAEAAWLNELAAAFRPAFDVGFGVAAFCFDARDPRRFRWSEPALVGTRDDVASGLTSTLHAVPPEVVTRTFLRGSALISASQALGLGKRFEKHPLAVAFAHPFGIHDVVALNVKEPSGNGMVLMSAQPRVRSVPRREAATWSMCAAHVGAALRLRRTLAEERPVDDAVLDGQGRCLHAEGDAQARSARDALRRAVLAAEEGRRASRKLAPEDALEAWHALVLGRWSLVEQFESDGHRYIVARRNAPDLSDPRGLLLRERQVAGYAALGHSVRLISYELGLAESTVAKYLKSAMNKLGASTRAELAARVRMGVSEPSGSETSRPS